MLHARQAKIGRGCLSRKYPEVACAEHQSCNTSSVYSSGARKQAHLNLGVRPDQRRSSEDTLGLENSTAAFVSGNDATSSRKAKFERNASVRTLIKRCEEAELKESVAALDLLVKQKCRINVSLFYRILRRCKLQKNLVLGSSVHALISTSGCESNAFLANHIIRMYAYHGQLDEAQEVFAKVKVPNSYTWAAIILAHADLGQPSEAVNLYRQMRKLRQQPDDHVFVAVLKACASLADFVSGKKVHADILRSANKPNMFVRNCLVDMYAKCGSLADAREVFDSMASKDVVTWNSMIAGYAQQGRAQEALNLYRSMHQKGVVPNRVTFVCVLHVCATIGALDHGKQLHEHISETGLEEDVFIGNSLVNMYAKCNRVVDARKIFDRLPVRDVVTWTSMITAYVHGGCSQEALLLYDDMLREGLTPPNHVTFVCLLKACGSIGALHQGKQLHAHICARGLELDVVVGSSLVDMYMKCGSLGAACRVFDRMPSKHVETWNVLISGFVSHGLGLEALDLYARMQLENNAVANHVTFSCLLQACAVVGDLHKGREVHAQIQLRALEDDMFVGSCLVSMYSKCGSLKDARQVFDRLPCRDVVTWTAMIAGYVHHGFGHDALVLYAEMQQDGLALVNDVAFVCLLQACSSAGSLCEGKLLHARIKEQGLEGNITIGNGLVDMYATCGSLEDARDVFESLPVKDVVAWNAMIGGYVHHGFALEALALYESMKNYASTPLNHVTFACLLQACASIGALNCGRQLHVQIEGMGMETDVIVGSCLVDMYAKCGSLLDAQRVFDRWSKKNVVTWNALLNGYAEHSEGYRAIQLFESMREQGVVPTSATFVSLLVACSHAGLVHEGRLYFRMMVKGYGITPNDYHYCCMIDLLGRSGRLIEAESLLQTLPLENLAVGWTSLLSACKSHGDIQRGKRCFDHLLKLEPENASSYVLLASIYANAGKRKAAEWIEGLRRLAGAGKKPAKACIELHSKVHEFKVGDEEGDILSKVRSLSARFIHEGGHVAQTELVLETVSEQHKEDALCGHAEKLALAYGLLRTPDGTSLLVTKNLRMCNDCHNSTKIMSRIEKREITVRDAHRVHCFQDGRCSCGDRQ